MKLFEAPPPQIITKKNKNLLCFFSVVDLLFAPCFYFKCQHSNNTKIQNILILFYFCWNFQMNDWTILNRIFFLLLYICEPFARFSTLIIFGVVSGIIDSSISKWKSLKKNWIILKIPQHISRFPGTKKLNPWTPK